MAMENPRCMHNGATDVDGAMNNRAMNNGTMDDRTMDNRAVDHGRAVKGGSMTDGSVNDGSVNDGSVPDWSMRSGVRRRPFVAAATTAACASLREGQCRGREHQRRGNG
jgi:hypothetical protein